MGLFCGSFVTSLCLRARTSLPPAVSVPLHEASLEHVGEHPLRLRRRHLLGPDFSEVLLEALNGLKLVLDGLLLSQRGCLGINLLLSGLTSNTCHLHPIEQKMGKKSSRLEV